MTPLTSMADFYFRVKTDERYKALLLYTKEKSVTGRNIQHDFENAVKWIEKWMSDNQNTNTAFDQCPCCIVVEIMNRNMIAMKKENLL